MRQPLTTQMFSNDRLLDYLRRKIDLPEADFRRHPAILAGGFDSCVFRFELEGVGNELSGPLVLRLLSSFRAPGDSRKEALLHRVLGEYGYPVPTVHLCETDADVLGAEFLIMDECSGRQLDSVFKPKAMSVRDFTRIPTAFRSAIQTWSEAHHALHKLPALDIANKLQVLGYELPTPLRLLGRMREMLGTRDLDRFGELLDWLEASCPHQSSGPVLCHGDFHGSNILVASSRLAAVIDWTEAALASPAFDVGTILATYSVMGGYRRPWPFGAGINKYYYHIASIYANKYAKKQRIPKEEIKYFELFHLIKDLTMHVALLKKCKNDLQLRRWYNLYAARLNRLEVLTTVRSNEFGRLAPPRIPAGTCTLAH